MTPRSSSRPELTLELVGPYRGECGICGGPDARHRLFDALQEANRAGDSIAFLADVYDFTEEYVAAIVAAPRWREPRRRRAA